MRSDRPNASGRYRTCQHRHPPDRRVAAMAACGRRGSVKAALDLGIRKELGWSRPERVRHCPACRTGRPYRMLLRSVHLAGGGVIGTYLYAPHRSRGALRPWLQVLVIPMLTATGIRLCQQASLRRIARRATTRWGDAPSPWSWSWCLVGCTTSTMCCVTRTAAWCSAQPPGTERLGAFGLARPAAPATRARTSTVAKILLMWPRVARP